MLRQQQQLLDRTLRRQQGQKGQRGRQGQRDQQGRQGQGEKPGEGEEAMAQESRALNQLSQGLRGLAEQLARQQGGGQRQGEAGEERATDPLGRPLPLGGMDTSRVKIPDQSDLQWAREILDELRRRAGELSRPFLERDYIDRLLRRF